MIVKLVGGPCDGGTATVPPAMQLSPILTFYKAQHDGVPQLHFYERQGNRYVFMKSVLPTQMVGQRWSGTL